MKAKPVMATRLPPRRMSKPPVDLCRIAVALSAMALPGTMAAATDLPASARPAKAPLDAAYTASEQWRVIESVLTHPRCINCHTATDYPRQGDDRHRHQFRVMRGPNDRGVAGALCAACHQEDNQASSGVPGAPNWHLAPRSMAFERAPGVAMTGKELCARLLDKKRNGNMELRGIEIHLTSDPLVQWAWSPGTDKDGSPRVPPPLIQDELLSVFNAWTAAGAPCPK
jgi:hypothetical protein